jgi:hypothetical protein
MTWYLVMMLVSERPITIFFIFFYFHASVFPASFLPCSFRAKAFNKSGGVKPAYSSHSLPYFKAQFIAMLDVFAWCPPFIMLN